jgi:hypothetical protein
MMLILIRNNICSANFKILIAPCRALASNIEKMAKKIKNTQFVFDIFKSFGTKWHIMAYCSARLVNVFEK